MVLLLHQFISLCGSVFLSPYEVLDRSDFIFSGGYIFVERISVVIPPGPQYLKSQLDPQNGKRQTRSRSPPDSG